ncbi:hypothetical protein [Burkholderia sp. Ed8]|uniref:hypothetical protein n=1 Tax=Burkholderia TaxID=32008 RepID=UPI00345DF038
MKSEPGGHLSNRRAIADVGERFIRFDPIVWVEEHYPGQVEVVVSIRSKVRNVLECQLGAPLADPCFSVYEYGLVSGVLGVNSDAARRLAIENSQFIEKMQTDSTRARYMKLSHELGMRHGELIRNNTLSN